jgi:4-hydroxy-2-oxoheptanedioate aldolase
MSFDPIVLGPNTLKGALRDGRRQIGLWSALCSNVAGEIISNAGFDWIVIDTEHAPNEIPGVLSQLQAMASGTAEPVVRCAWNDTVLIKRILDIGARSILVPFVQSANEAKRAVEATRYPPLGNRGVAASHRANRWGQVGNYHAGAHREICVLVQIETRAALADVEAIAAVDGVDGLFIGPSDLASDLGHLGQLRHPDVQAAFESACRRIRSAGKAAGILAPDPDDAARYLHWGYTFVAVGTDAGILAQTGARLAAQFKEQRP